MDINVPPETTTSSPASASARWTTPMAMVLVQLFITGMILLSKVSIGGGMFIFTLLAYRSFFGSLFILPFALIYERYVPYAYLSCMHTYQLLKINIIHALHGMAPSKPKVNDLKISFVPLICRGKWRNMTWLALRWIFLNAFIGYVYVHEFLICMARMLIHICSPIPYHSQYPNESIS